MTGGYGGQDVFFDAAEGGDATRSGPVSGGTARTSGAD
jgi:hypothetical protein